jgi:hypothetical protein
MKELIKDLCGMALLHVFQRHPLFSSQTDAVPQTPLKEKVELREHLERCSRNSSFYGVALL